MPQNRVVTVTVLIGATAMIAVGLWGWLDPADFADWAGWPHHEHFLHDAGVFQIAIGLTMLVALWWRDPITVVLTGFVFTNVFHALNHYLDRADGGRDGDWAPLLALAALGAIGLFLQRRRTRVTRGV